MVLPAQCDRRVLVSLKVLAKEWVPSLRQVGFMAGWIWLEPQRGSNGSSSIQSSAFVKPAATWCLGAFRMAGLFHWRDKSAAFLVETLFCREAVSFPEPLFEGRL